MAGVPTTPMNCAIRDSKHRSRRGDRGGHARFEVLLIAYSVAATTLGAQGGNPQGVDLAKLLMEGRLKTVNREVSKLADKAGGVHLSERSGVGIAWIEGLDFGEGQIVVDVRGRDLYQRSFVGIAFHGKDDATYEAVYLRPFNFRAVDPMRHRHALQYMEVPDFDWPKLRDQFPDEFERPVAGSVSPSDWVTLRVAVHDKRVEVSVGPGKVPVFSERKLGNLNQGIIGLWAGNGSDGDFANLQIQREK